MLGVRAGHLSHCLYVLAVRSGLGPSARQAIPTPAGTEHTSGLGRDAALASRRLRYRPQSRASSLPQSSAGDCARELCGRQPWLPTAARIWRRAQPIAVVGVRRPFPQEARLRPRFGRIPCGSGLGRDAAGTCRGRCYRPQSRASSLPQNPARSNADRDRECHAFTTTDRRRICPGVTALPSGRRSKRRRTGGRGVADRVR